MAARLIPSPARRMAFIVFLGLVFGHWVEHAVQLAQVHVLGWSRGHSHGLLGTIWPWLATSEMLHFLYALGMLVGLVVFVGLFSGAARAIWVGAIGTQAWHQCEHLLLVVQVYASHNLFGQP